MTIAYHQSFNRVGCKTKLVEVGTPGNKIHKFRSVSSFYLLCLVSTITRPIEAQCVECELLRKSGFWVQQTQYSNTNEEGYASVLERHKVVLRRRDPYLMAMKGTSDNAYDLNFLIR